MLGKSHGTLCFRKLENIFELSIFHLFIIAILRKYIVLFWLFFAFRGEYIL